MLSSAALDLSFVEALEPPDSAPVRANRAKTARLLVSDQELVRRALNGDTSAETAIVKRHTPDIRALALRMLADREEANDVVQETFLHAFAAWAQLREPARLKGWLSSIAFSLAHREFRRRKKLRLAGVGSSADQATIEAVAALDCSVERMAEFALLARRLRRTSHRVRRAWLLHDVEGLPVDVIADECGCSGSTVKRRIAKARKLLGAFCAPRRA